MANQTEISLNSTALFPELLHPRGLCLWSGDKGKQEDPGNNGPLSCWHATSALKLWSTLIHPPNISQLYLKLGWHCGLESPSPRMPKATSSLATSCNLLPAFGFPLAYPKALPQSLNLLWAPSLSKFCWGLDINAPHRPNVDGLCAAMLFRYHRFRNCSNSGKSPATPVPQCNSPAEESIQERGTTWQGSEDTNRLWWWQVILPKIGKTGTL